ncbi:MAG: FHA domain-containing protein [Acidobacteriota bacterium]
MTAARAVLAVELHDVATLAKAGGDDEPRARVPAVVRLDGSSLRVGSDAAAGARKLPKLAHDRFWHDLSTEPLGAPFPSAWTVADLAHAHLEEVWRQAAGGAGIKSVILAVGGPLEEESLGLLLGVARALAMPVRGVVSAPLLASAGALRRFEEPAALHLDLTRHGVTLTRLERRGPGDGEGERGLLTAGRVRQLPGLGQARLEERLADAVSGAFVRATRFDPLHRSADEQRLFDRLPGWLRGLDARSAAGADAASVGTSLEVRFDRAGGGAPLAIELRRAEMREAIRQEVQTLLGWIGHGSEPVLLAPHAGPCLGLIESALRSAGRETVRLEPAAAVDGALERADLLLADGPPSLVVSLPESAQDPDDELETEGGGDLKAEGGGGLGTEGERPSPKRPTHLLIGDLAIPLEPGRALAVGTHPGEEGERPVSLAELLSLDPEAAEELAGVSRRHLTVHFTAHPAEGSGGVTVVDHSRYGTFMEGERLDGEASAPLGCRLRLGPSSRLELRLIRVEAAHGEP